MKKRFSLAFTMAIIHLVVYVTGQTPQALNYQAVARNLTGAVLQNQHVSIRFSIHDGSPSATIVYQETDTATTNQFGLFTSHIGSGAVTIGTFIGINWSTGGKYLEIELDPNGGNSYTNMGITQMVSVPYALYANSAGTTTAPATGYDILFNGISMSDSSLNFAFIGYENFITKTNYVFNLTPNVATISYIDSLPYLETVVTDDTVAQSNIYLIGNTVELAGAISKIGNRFGDMPIHNGQIYYVPLNATPVSVTNLFMHYSGAWQSYPASTLYQALPNNVTVTGFNLPDTFTLKFVRH